MHITYTISWFIYIAAGLFVLFYIFFWLKLRRISKGLSSPILGRVYIKTAVRSIAFALLAIALLGPMFGNESQVITIDKKRLMFVADVSLSMDSRDLAPSRLEKSKQIIHRICAQTPGYEYGLIIFSGDAVLQCPYTKDVDAFLVFVSSLHSSMLSDRGTFPNAAFELANMTVKSMPTDFPDIMVYLSDGEYISEALPSVVSNKWLEPFSAQYLVGIGSPDGSRIPEGNYFKKDNKGNYIQTYLHPKELSDFANQTGSKYIEISDQEDNLNDLIYSIRFGLTQKTNSQYLAIESNRFRYLLIPAFILLFLDMLFSFKTIKL